MSTKTQFLSIVDDEPDIMSLFKEALSHMGDTEVFGFIDSTLALEHFTLNQLDYCLILSDYRMPIMDGMELLKKVKAINPSVKTVLVSAYAANDEVFEQCNCVDAFLQKPISIPDLIDAVEIQISVRHG
jgi:DNA-binding NtrC family response regulator